MGKVAAEMCTVMGASTPAELPRPTAAIHHFQTHAARTQRICLKNYVERSDERLNMWLCTYTCVHAHVLPGNLLLALLRAFMHLQHA